MFEAMPRVGQVWVLGQYGYLTGVKELSYQLKFDFVCSVNLLVSYKSSLIKSIFSDLALHKS